MEKTYPDAKRKTLIHWAGQLWSYARMMKRGDLVALPLKERPSIAFGEILGEYEYKIDFPSGARHTRPVKWLKEVPRSSLDQDLRHSLGAFMTVCRVQRNQAEERVRALLAGRGLSQQESREEVETEPTDLGALYDVEETARDQVQTFVARKGSRNNKLNEYSPGFLPTRR